MYNSLSKLKKVELRKIWKHEAKDFTPWLASENNLEILSEEIGIEIINPQTEVSIGAFKIDILAEDSNGRKIVIENQLETTNHDHLGKIITYASGKNAEFIIWIVSDVKEEHRQAIDWLNENTDEKINFFLIKLELWQIDNSKLAPKFQKISVPNNWQKVVKGNSSEETNTRKLKLLDFWTALNKFLENKSSPIHPQKPLADNWNNVSLGTSKAHISIDAVHTSKFIRVGVYIPDNKKLYHHLEANKATIENIFGSSLDWRELPDKKASRIVVIKHGFNLYDESCWQDFFEWIEVQVINLKNAIKQFII